MTTKSNIILVVQGGAGDVLAHTPMIRSMRKAYPDDKIIVLATYKQLLENNPNIDILLPLSQPRDFYQEFVIGQKVRFFKKHFVYDAIMDEPAKGCKTLPEFICKLYGVEYDGESPDYFITDYEKRFAENFVRQSRSKGFEIVLLHISGAVPSEGGYQIMICGGCAGKGIASDGSRCSICNGSGKVVVNQKTNNLKDLAPEVLEPLVKEYSNSFHFLQIGLEGEPLIPGAYDCLGMSMRETIALIPEAKSFIFIESLFAHAAGALEKRGVVVFQNTSPRFFGYSSAVPVYDSHGCDDWPCNRPVGALLDLAPGYKDPKSRQPVLWECNNQVCKIKETSSLIHGFLKSLERPDDGHDTLEQARAR